MNHEDGHWLYRIIYDKLQFCGCGNPEDSLALVRAVLSLTPLYDHQDELALLLPENGARQIVLGVMTNADLIEHGGGIGGSWITDEGQRFLELTEGFDIDDLDETGFSCSNCTPEEQAAARK